MLSDMTSDQQAFMMRWTGLQNITRKRAGLVASSKMPLSSGRPNFCKVRGMLCKRAFKHP